MKNEVEKRKMIQHIQKFRGGIQGVSKVPWRLQMGNEKFYRVFQKLQMKSEN